MYTRVLRASSHVLRQVATPGGNASRRYAGRWGATSRYSHTTGPGRSWDSDTAHSPPRVQPKVIQQGCGVRLSKLNTRSTTASRLGRIIVRAHSQPCHAPPCQVGLATCQAFAVTTCDDQSGRSAAINSRRNHPMRVVVAALSLRASHLPARALRFTNGAASPSAMGITHSWIWQ